MNTLRFTLATIFILAGVYAWVAAFAFGLRDWGIAMAIAAVCLIGQDVIKEVLIERDRRREHARQYLKEVWERREFDEIVSHLRSDA